MSLEIPNAVHRQRPDKISRHLDGLSLVPHNRSGTERGGPGGEAVPRHAWMATLAVEPAEHSASQQRYCLASQSRTVSPPSRQSYVSHKDMSRVVFEPDFGQRRCPATGTLGPTYRWRGGVISHAISADCQAVRSHVLCLMRAGASDWCMLFRLRLMDATDTAGVVARYVRLFLLTGLAFRRAWRPRPIGR